jgi:hypothetical protein
MISARPLELIMQQKKNRNKNNWSDFSVAYLEISHRKESENHVCLQCPIIEKKIVSCFDIEELPRSPGKWSWHLLSFLPFISIFKQCE